MNNREKIIATLIGGFIVFFIGTTFYLHNQVAFLNNVVSDKKSDRIKIETFIQSSPSQVTRNTSAYSVINKQDESYSSSEMFNRYKAEEGFVLISDSQSWDENKLKELYHELKRNKHGEEFERLFKVIVHAEPDTLAAGMHERTSEELSLFFDFPAFPDSSRINFTRNMGTIHLYDGDELTEVAQYAHTLSHEYGHHYTFYHMFKENRLINSEYEKIRNIQEYDVFYEISENYNHYIQNHLWYLVEIAAEDYVQLMGSPMTKDVVRYTDVYQRLEGQATSSKRNSYNGTIQENMLIPLADEVAGLNEYFHQFISLEPNQTQYRKKSFDLSIHSGSTHHNSMNGPLDFTHYIISWDDVYQADVIYTLLCMEPDGSNLFPLKTVYPGEPNSAYIGSVSFERNGYIHWNYDRVDSGSKIFMVTALLPDGTLYKSNSLSYQFN